MMLLRAKGKPLPLVLANVVDPPLSHLPQPPLPSPWDGFPCFLPPFPTLSEALHKPKGSCQRTALSKLFKVCCVQQMGTAIHRLCFETASAFPHSCRHTKLRKEHLLQNWCMGVPWGGTSFY
jgi:hypothetical protein